jgi:hypothetical protein
MQEKKVKNLQIVPPKASAFKYDTPPDLPKLHQNVIFVGARGSGKGVSMANMIRMMPFDRCLILSPTVLSNKEILKDLNIADTDVFDPDDKDSVSKILKIIDQEVEDLERYRHEMKLFKKFNKLLSQSNSFIPDEMLELFYTGSDFKPPEHKYQGREPILALIVDDCQSTPLFRSRQFQNMVVRHRHCGMFKSGGALGISLFMCIQNYTAQGGLPRAIRGNVTSMCIFSIKDEKQLDQIASECAGEIEKDKFYEVYKTAIRDNENFEFLFVDFNKKPNHPSAFRRYFDTFLLI